MAQGRSPGNGTVQEFMSRRMRPSSLPETFA
jgi:hypothetical protein